MLFYHIQYKILCFKEENTYTELSSVSTLIPLSLILPEVTSCYFTVTGVTRIDLKYN